MVKKRIAPTTSEKATAPETLRECLAPLAAAAVQTSALAYAWGIKHRQLMRAGMVMDIAGSIVEQCNQILRHEDSAATVASDVAKQMAHASAPAKRAST